MKVKDNSHYEFPNNEKECEKMRKEKPENINSECESGGFHVA